MLTMAMLHDAQRVLSGVINKTPVIPLFFPLLTNLL